MAALNEDCWHVVFGHLEPETRTLYNCLFVSKQFFALSTRILYRQPLKVFGDQAKYSPFSKDRLANLLCISSGFINPTTFASTISPAGVVEWKQQPQPIHAFNYYGLVKEYNQFDTVQPTDGHYLNCFAGTLPVLATDVHDFNLLLPLVSKFRALHTLRIDSPMSCHKLREVVQFIELHGRLFPGSLKYLTGQIGSRSWQQMVVIVEAMGGLEKQQINLKQDLRQHNLGQLNVSRLKSLTLNCSDGEASEELETKTMLQILKRCQRLETLELCWSNYGVGLNWNLLLSEAQSDDCIIGSNSLPSEKSSAFKLQHLIVNNCDELPIHAMKIFHETLESISIDGESRFEYVPPVVDYSWKGFFGEMRKLKSLELKNVAFQVENLSCCPVLETLVLWAVQLPLHPQNIWPRDLLPLNLRKLELIADATVQFDVLLLRPLVQLEHLTLTGVTIQPKAALGMINMSVGWSFPRLKHVDLFGKFAIQIQGQILWLAPRLEYLKMNLWVPGRIQYDLNTDTFLFPPWGLTFGEIMDPSQLSGREGSEMAPATRAIYFHWTPTTRVRSSFPNLKSLSLETICTRRFDSGEAFGNMFFGQRHGEIGDATTLFPNLEQLSFCFDRVLDLEFFLPSAIIALKSLPKLETLRYLRHYSEHLDNEVLSKWFEEIPQNGLNKNDSNFRNRPMMVGGQGTGELLTGGDGINRSGCVVEFTLTKPVQYQLKKIAPALPPSIKQRVVDGIKEGTTSAWKYVFSQQ